MLQCFLTNINIEQGVSLSTILVFQLIDYVQEESKWCIPGPLETLDGIRLEEMENVPIKAAQKACDIANNCAMFYDVGSLQNKFVFCPRESNVIDSSIASTMYLKCRSNKNICLEVSEKN